MRLQNPDIRPPRPLLATAGGCTLGPLGAMSLITLGVTTRASLGRIDRSSQRLFGAIRCRRFRGRLLRAFRRLRGGLRRSLMRPGADHARAHTPSE